MMFFLKEAKLSKKVSLMFTGHLSISPAIRWDEIEMPRSKPGASLKMIFNFRWDRFFAYVRLATTVLRSAFVV
jgi:hypothetical protein